MLYKNKKLRLWKWSQYAEIIIFGKIGVKLGSHIKSVNNNTVSSSVSAL